MVQINDKLSILEDVIPIEPSDISYAIKKAMGLII